MTKTHKIALIACGIGLLTLIVFLVITGQATEVQSGPQGDELDVVSLTAMMGFRIPAVMYFESNSNSYAGLCDTPFIKNLKPRFVTTECEAAADYYRVIGELPGGNFACLYVDETIPNQEEDFFVAYTKPGASGCGEDAPTFSEYLKSLRE